MEVITYVTDDIKGGPNSFFDLQARPFFIDNAGRKRVAQYSNSRQNRGLNWQGDGQQPDKHYQQKPKSSESVCPVVDIRYSAGYKGLRYKNLCPACCYNSNNSQIAA